MFTSSELGIGDNMNEELNDIAKWYCEHEITATEYKNEQQVDK